MALHAAETLTADDVANRMTAEQQNAYLFGLSDMAAHLFVRVGDPDRAACITEWSGSEESIREIDDALRANAALGAPAVWEVLMLRHCGAYQ